MLSLQTPGGGAQLIVETRALSASISQQCYPFKLLVEVHSFSLKRVYVLSVCHRNRPDMTFAVDWVLNTNYLCISNRTGFDPVVRCSHAAGQQTDRGLTRSASACQSSKRMVYGGHRLVSLFALVYGFCG